MKIYLDTSVISALFDERNPERKSLTEEFFSEIEIYTTYISELTIAEIDRTPDPLLRRKMKETIRNFTTLEITESTEELATEYVKYGAIPESYFEDAYHIAVSVLNEMDYLLSWNYRHIVRRKTKDIVRMVNSLRNLKQVEIITPGELL
ncbi:MAG: type II toxin-antitoxin system VapC family toxin [Calditrichaeota bacterium]|nr:type II toxin-antitoxin system VapC family toxin [Calditrichota bacterium]